MPRTKIWQAHTGSALTCQSGQLDTCWIANPSQTGCLTPTTASQSESFQSSKETESEGRGHAHSPRYDEGTKHSTFSRRSLISIPFLSLAASSGAATVFATVAAPAASAATVPPAKIDPSLQPSAAFDPQDQGLLEAARVFQAALEAKTVEEEERLWSEVIAIGERADAGATWTGDILSRAYGNRGNARSRQGSLEAAIGDYNKAIELAPYAADPVLNRGVALESLRRFDEAAADYRAVLAADPRDPAAWNNLGNIMAATGQWQQAADDYERASQLAPEFSFAAANLALALYQLGDDNRAMRQMRTLLRRYPEFPDMRAALAVSLYSAGIVGDAETNWTRLEDLRYKSVSWVRDVRRWPPRLVAELERFLTVSTF